jgi:hypothetical protein
LRLKPIVNNLFATVSRAAPLVGTALHANGHILAVTMLNGREHLVEKTDSHVGRLAIGASPSSVV